jgi:hypothetical protein
MVQNLEAMQDTITPRTLLENDLAAASFTRTQAAIHIVNFYKTDTVLGSASADSIKYYLKQLSTFEGYLQLAETYIEEGDVSTANNTIDTLISNFELTIEQLNEANHYKQLNNIRNGITAENRTIYELTTGEVNTLQQISDTSNLFSDEKTPPIVNYKLDGFKVFPNPNKGNINLIIPEIKDQLFVTIFNALGQNVYTLELPKNQKQVLINMQAFNQGMYYLLVYNQKQIMFNEKIQLAK